MKTNDYIKFMTQQLVKYFDEPKEERMARQESKKESKLPINQSLFGLLPVALSHSFRKRKK